MARALWSLLHFERRHLDDFARILSVLAKALGHDFRDPNVLADALTHRSFLNEKKGARDNERLEFLGDAVIGLAAAQALYERHADAQEGELTKRRAAMVNRQALAKIARALNLSEALRLGRGEERSGGRDKERLLASAFEACIAAIFVDAGMEASVDAARRLLLEHIEDIDPGAQDFKTRFQEIIQGELHERPRYELVRTSGPEHERIFEVAVFVGADELARATGRSKSDAEQNAARLAMESRAQKNDALSSS